MSEKENYELGRIISTYNIGAGYFHKLQRDSALAYYEKSYNYSEKNNDSIWIMNTSTNIGQVFSDKYQFDSASTYYNIALENAKKVKDSSAIGYILKSIGDISWKKGEFNSAIEYYKKSLNLLKIVGGDKRISASLNNIGTAYYQLGNYQIALKYFIEASEYRNRYSELDSPVLLNSIGLIYLELNDDDLAYNYFIKALNNAKKINSILGEGYSYLNLGDYYYRQKEYKQALDYFNKSKQLYSELKDENGIAKILNKIGLVYLETKQTQKAEKSFLTAYEMGKNSKLKQIEVESFVNYNKIQLLKGDYNLVKTNLEQIYKLALSENLVDSRLQILNLQSKLFEKSNEFKTALEYRGLYENLNDSLFNEKSLRVISELKEKYEVDKKEKENISLQYLNQIQKLELENQAKEKLYIGIISIFFFFIIGYLFYLNILRKRRNASLVLAKKEVEIINEKLNETNKLLQNSNSTKDKFFSIISHDLKNPFGTLLGATQILKMDKGEMSAEDRKELIEIISNDSEKLYALLENLLFWANSQTGKLKASKVNIHLNSLIVEVVDLFKSNAKSKEIELIIYVPTTINVVFDEFMLKTIIRNLITNAIKFSFNGGAISIIAEEKDDKINLKIKDNGIGISQENQAKIFNENSEFKQIGTNKEKGTGLGLILCRDFIKENDASITVISEVGKGTTFELILEKAV